MPEYGLRVVQSTGKSCFAAAFPSDSTRSGVNGLLTTNSCAASAALAFAALTTSRHWPASKTLVVEFETLGHWPWTTAQAWTGAVRWPTATARESS
jgi:hypothetical protein